MSRMRPQVSEEHEVCEETQPEQASDCQEGSQEVRVEGVVRCKEVSAVTMSVSVLLTTEINLQLH